MPPRQAKALTVMEVRRLTKPGNYMVGGVPGLLLRVKPTGSRQWALRAMVGGKRREIGLGGCESVTLKMARERARECRDQIYRGLDPVEERRKRREALRAEAETRITVSDAWAAFWRDKSAGLAATTRRHWVNSVERYALPVIGSMVV
ncbi:MAG: Arm DNA-binding domain-containing protein, partial [Wenzhouxiangella sp.]|nr:Arm DNA-binding domain-containing protein [Wenzhouxiangella sp.]